MKLQLVFALIFFSNITLTASDSLPMKKLYYKTELRDTLGNYKYGYLTTLTDDDVYYSDEKMRFGSPVNAANRKNNYTVINQIKIKRKGSAVRGAVAGAIIGTGIGVIAGFIEGDDKYIYIDPAQDFLGIASILANVFTLSAEEKATIYGLSLGSGGAIVGALIGAVAHKKFIIGGNRDRHLAMKQNIIEKVYGNYK